MCVCVCVCVCLDIVKVTEQKLRCCYELLAKLPGTDTGYSVQIKVGTALQKKFCSTKNPSCFC